MSEMPEFLMTLLLPPANMMLVAAAGWLLLRRWRRVGRVLMAGGILGLYALSTPIVGSSLLLTLQTISPLTETDFDVGAGAIVVLSAHVYQDVPSSGVNTVNSINSINSILLRRARYGARLYRATGVPLLTTGGKFDDDGKPQGEAMATILEDAFKVPVRWVETAALNTFQNAERSAAILHPEGITKIYLVTSAPHMPRAKASFETVGFDVVPAPTGFSSPIEPKLADFLPSAKGLESSAVTFYELIARLWYRLAF